MERLILFARRPELGRVKTRLSPPATAEEALALYEAFLDDQARFVVSLAGPERVAEACFDGSWPRLRDLPSTEQGEGDLGERMARALRRAHDAGAASAVIVGADAPSLPADRVEGAFATLARGADAVIVPSEDGGYVLVGTRGPRPILFAGIPWGSPEVSALTRRRAAEAGLALAELPAWRDVDTWSDLAALRADLQAAPERAPATARALAAIVDGARGPVV